MRGWSKGLLLGIAALVLFIAVIIFPYPTMEVNVLLFWGMVGFLILGFMLWGTEEARKHSTHFSGFGAHTSLYQESPVDECQLDTGEKEGGEHTFYKYLANGCQALYMKGGKSHGMYIVRDDCRVTIPGDETNVWVFGVPEYYMVGARPGDKFKPLEYLPKEMYEMVVRSDFDPRGAVGVFWRPHSNKRVLSAEMKAERYYQGLYEAENQENAALRKQLDSINKGSTRQAESHEKAWDAYAPNRRRPLERPPRDDERRDD